MNDSDRAEVDREWANAPILTGNEAYIREVSVDGAAVYGIHAPDGRLLGIAPDRDIAFVVARQHQLDPLSVH